MRIHPAASRVKLLAAGDAGLGRVLGPALRGRARSHAAAPSASAARALEALLAGAQPPLHVTPATEDRARRGRLVPPLRGRGPRRRDGEARRRRVRAEQARDAEGEARARVRLRRRGLPLAQARRGRRRWARCCSASTTTRARSSTSASPRASPTRSGASWSTSLAPYREDALGGPPWKDWAGEASRRGDGQRMPGAKSRWSQGKDLVVGAAAPRARGRGRLRPHAGPALPPHRAVPALAAPTSSRATAPTRSSRWCAPHELAGDLRERALGQLFASPSAAPATRASGRRPGRASPAAGAAPRARCAGSRGSRVQVDDRPRIESTSTSSTRELRRRLGMARLPALEARERGVLARRVRDDDERHLRARGFFAARASRATARRAAPRPPSCGSAAATARRRGPPPRRAPRARAAPSSEPAAASIPACGSPICGEARAAPSHREVGGLAVGHLVPARAASRRARRGAGAPSRPSRSCGPSRSGCSRGRRRGAPPSTTSRSRATGARRSISRESASAARRTSVKRPARLDAHVHVHAARAARLRPAARGRAPRAAPSPRARRARTSAQATPGPGIEIDAQLVGVLEVGRAHRVRVQLDAAEVHDPGEPGRVVDDHLLGGAARTGTRASPCAASRAASSGARFW